MQPKPTAWDGFARLSRAGEGLIVVFKNETRLQQAEVQIPVYPEGDYRVRSVITGDSLGVVPGRQFRPGLTVPLPENYTTQILEVRSN
jgi:hypothetical protein